MRDESSGILVTDDDNWAFVFANIRKDRKLKVYFMLNLDEWVQMGFRAKKVSLELVCHVFFRELNKYPSECQGTAR